MKNPKDDYDNPWKDIITGYFKELMWFFFPDAASEIDWNREVVFLDKEFQQISRNAEIGSRRADKLVQVHTKDGNENWVLVHVEVQSQYESGFAKRIYTYNYRVFDMYDRRVASLVILADDHPNWKPSVFSYELWGCHVSLKYPLVKLIEYQERTKELEEDSNPFAIVVQAHLKTLKTRNEPEKRYSAKLNLIRALYNKGYSREEVVDLFAFIDWIMRLPESLEKSLWQILEKLEEETRMPYITSVQRIGREEGKEEGVRKLLSKQIHLKFKENQDILSKLLMPLSLPQLEELGTKIFEIETFDQVRQWINKAK